jgi:prevent-host-death family protein
MATTTISDAPRDFADLCNRVAYGGERIIIERHGIARVALVPAEDVELLEALEDKLDLKAALQALQEAEEQGTTGADELKRELGL